MATRTPLQPLPPLPREPLRPLPLHNPPPPRPAPLPVWVIINRQTDAVAFARVFATEHAAQHAIDLLVSWVADLTEVRRAFTVMPVYVESDLDRPAPPPDRVTVLRDANGQVAAILTDTQIRDALAAEAAPDEYPDNHLATDPPPRLPLWAQRACFWVLMRVPDGAGWPRWWSRWWEWVAIKTTPPDGF